MGWKLTEILWRGTVENSDSIEKLDQSESLKSEINQSEDLKLFCTVQNKFNQLKQEVLKSSSSFVISVQNDRKQKLNQKDTSIVQIEAVFFMRLAR